MAENLQLDNQRRTSWIEAVAGFCLRQRLVVFLVTLLFIGWGVLVSPFDWSVGTGLKSPVAVDAIPDIGENQQVVFTPWAGRSPQDVEDQITYPLTSALLGVPGVKSIRSESRFGFSSIYVIFEDGIDFYWSRTRILEKLNSLASGTLPPDVQPALGPDATAMGQVYWYTLEGRDENGQPAGGWDLNELRTIQDWYVRYALMSVDGVAEAASVGGFVQEYQVDLDPDLMRVNDVGLDEVVAAVKDANLDVGAQTLEVNKVEYFVRGVGFIRNAGDIENAVIKLRGGIPVYVKTVANVVLGPAARQGALDKSGAETVGGVVAVRYGENPLRVIKGIRQKIEEIAPGMPRKTLPDGRVSQVNIVPFYDRAVLIRETLGTLESALSNEILVTLLVIIVMIFFLRSALLIAGMLPLVVLMCFVAMKLFGVDANIVALSGIAIAIGTVVDMGIIVTENIARHLKLAGPEDNRLETVYRATCEVSGAVMVAVSTTVVSFLPVFALVAAEGKLFRPLAFTKTFALCASLIVAICIIPAGAYLLLGSADRQTRRRRVLDEALIYLGGVLIFALDWKIGLLVAAAGGYNLVSSKLPATFAGWKDTFQNLLAAVGAALLLAHYWLPLGPEKGLAVNFAFVFFLVGGILGGLRLFLYFYQPVLGWCLDHKPLFLSLPAVLVLFGLLVWQGYHQVFGWAPEVFQQTRPATWLAGVFPGLGKEFMPPLDEGAYLMMPTTMPHASIGEALDILQKQDMAIQRIPEVRNAVGKIGRAESPLDPAPVSMIETLIDYQPEFLTGPDDEFLTFRFDSEKVDLARGVNGELLTAPDGKPYFVEGSFLRDEQFRLIPDPDGRPFRLWRPPVDPALNPGRYPWQGVRTPDDIWRLVISAANVPGTTTASRLQPISARMVMLQSGIRASMGVKVKGPDLKSIEDASRQIEEYLRQVPSIEPATVIADRVIGKPYLEIRIDRERTAQYGIRLQPVLDVIEYAIGGRRVTTTVEGRERYPVRVRYIRELRNDLESLEKILVPAPDGTQIPLSQLAEIYYVKGPQVIKSEDTFLVGYVLFDKKNQAAEVDTVEDAKGYLQEMIGQGRLNLPEGVSYSFVGTYENQVRSEKRLALIIPVALIIIFLILYLHFHSVSTSSLVFSGIVVAWSGGFLMIWLYSQPWFLNFSFGGVVMRDVFQIHPVNLSVAVWVGFLALFGIATDDGVVMATYLENDFGAHRPASVRQIRQTTIEAASKRVRPCLMTTATTIIALIPVLTSTGRGADVMIPMAIPTFGGMTIEIVTMLVVPVIYCALKEKALARGDA